MDYTIAVDDFDKKTWAEEAEKFADFSIYQTWDYQENRCRMDGMGISRAIVSDAAGEPVLMGQVRIKNVPVVGLRIGYVQWGPLHRRKDRYLQGDSRPLTLFRETFLKQTVNVLRIKPNCPVFEPQNGAKDLLIKSGYEHQAHIRPYHTIFVDTEAADEEIRTHLSKSYRRELKIAEKKGDFEIYHGNEDHCHAVLEKMYHDSVLRKGFKGLNLEEFTGPQATLPDNQKLHYIIISNEGQPATFVVTTYLGNASIVLLAASNEYGLKHKGSYLGWYLALMESKRRGMKWCDLGGIDPDNNPGVYAFKSRFGGQEIQYVGEFESYANSLVKNIWRGSEKLYRMLKGSN